MPDSWKNFMFWSCMSDSGDTIWIISQEEHLCVNLPPAVWEDSLTVTSSKQIAACLCHYQGVACLLSPYVLGLDFCFHFSLHCCLHQSSPHPSTFCSHWTSIPLPILPHLFTIIPSRSKASSSLWKIKMFDLKSDKTILRNVNILPWVTKFPVSSF